MKVCNDWFHNQKIKIDMLTIRRNDIITLADRTPGLVVGIITTKTAEVYKIKKITDQQVIYVEDNMVRLERQFTKNFILTFLKEMVNFLCYTLNLRV
jgi:hypothetical protein